MSDAFVLTGTDGRPLAAATSEAGIHRSGR